MEENYKEMNFFNKIKTLALPKRGKPQKKAAEQLASVIQVRQDSLLTMAQDLGRKEPRDWRHAREAYADPLRPRNDYLQDLYQDALLDPHLQAVQQKRLLTLQNKDFVFRQPSGEIDELKSEWLTRDWFRSLLTYVLESRFFGYSLIWIKGADPASGELSLELVDRRRVVPQRATLRARADVDEQGLLYLDYPTELLFACLGRAKGLLEIASIATIMKRHSLAAWGEFERVFGMPLRIVKLPSLQSEQVEEVEHWMKEMGTAAYAILPMSAEIDVKESTKTDAHEVFERKIELLNKENSKLYLGQTMTTDDGSSLSQSQTHSQTEGQLLRADESSVLGWLNKNLLPALAAHGFPITAGDQIGLPEAVDPQQRLEQDRMLLSAGVPLSKKYLEETYDVEIDDAEPDESDEAGSEQLFLDIKKKAKRRPPSSGSFTPGLT